MNHFPPSPPLVNIRLETTGGRPLVPDLREDRWPPPSSLESEKTGNSRPREDRRQTSRSMPLSLNPSRRPWRRGLWLLSSAPAIVVPLLREGRRLELPPSKASAAPRSLAPSMASAAPSSLPRRPMVHTPRAPSFDNLRLPELSPMTSMAGATLPSPCRWLYSAARSAL
jgi:hypothetical protein